MDSLHIRLEAMSASYSYPFLKSGTQLTLPAPPFSSILGNISACVGRAVGPEETQIGYEFASSGKALDLERTQRLRTDKRFGRLSMNPERGIAKRQFHVRPVLDLYLTQIAFEKFFYEPVAAPCLGRSQDLGWIRFVRRIRMTPVEQGVIRSTVVRLGKVDAGGIVLPPLADYYRNNRTGYVREAGRYSHYQFVRQLTTVTSSPDCRLFHPDDSELANHAVVLHDLTA